MIHEATFPRYERDWRYRERQLAALQAGLLWGAYHFADGTDPIRQADHFVSMVASSHPLSTTPVQEEKNRPGVLLVLDFEKNHYHGGNMSVGQAVAFAATDQRAHRQISRDLRQRESPTPIVLWCGLRSGRGSFQLLAMGRELSRSTTRHFAVGPMAHVAIYGRRPMCFAPAQRVPDRRGQHAQGRAEHFQRKQRCAPGVLERTRLVPGRLRCSENPVRSA